MALIRAMNTAITGLRAQQNRISVIGDNLANSTTTAFKTGRVMFETLLSQTTSFGTAPQGFLGGVDPMQIGLGVQMGDTTKNFAQGVLEATGIHSDIAVEGDGFFVLNDVEGSPVYTRDGSFTINPENFLHNPSNGYIVQGWNADLTTFEIPVGGPLEDLQIPQGDLRIANATTEAFFDGNLNGAGIQALDGTVMETQQFVDIVTGLPATGATLLTDLGRVDTSGNTDLLLNVGDTIEVRGEKGNRTLPTVQFLIDSAPNQTVAAAGTTLGQLVEFLQNALGIAPDGLPTTDLINGAMVRNQLTNPPIPETGFASGVTASSVSDPTHNFTLEGVDIGDIIRFNTGDGAGQIAIITSISTTLNPNDTLGFTPLDLTKALPVDNDQFSIHEATGAIISTGFLSTGTAAPTPAGAIRIRGNVGLANDITKLQLITGGQSLTSLTKDVTATGESMLSNATFYDSLGAPHTVELTMVLETKGGTSSTLNTAGNIWRYYGEAADEFTIANAVPGSFIPTRVIGTGTVTFSVDGQFLESNPLNSLILDVKNTGAATPVMATPDFTKMTGFQNKLSEMSMVEQDGFRQGVLSDFTIGVDGTVNGIFSNGMTRNVAQIALARFNNNNGLAAIGNSLFQEAANSGIPIVGAAGSFGRGILRGGYLEESNVDFAIEFTSLIVAQRAFQANAKTIQTSSELLQDLVQLG